ncbi:MAG: hypothetical protein M3O92_00295 [Actinomycetota bacterium]|nr:hypothetical protein [Actinomycetota bacterium]
MTPKTSPARRALLDDLEAKTDAYRLLLRRVEDAYTREVARIERELAETDG